MANLRRWASEGVDANNPAHVNAYILARQMYARPRAEQVLALAASETTSHTTGAELSQSFTLIPKWNFGTPGGPPVEMPEWLSEWIVTEEELREDYEVPDDFDLSAVFLCDGGVDTTGLKRVKTYVFKEKLETRMKGSSAGRQPTVSQTAPAGALPLRPTKREPGCCAPDSASSAAARPDSASSAAARPPARLALQAGSAEEPPEVPSKRQRVLKAMLSDDGQSVPPEDQEAAAVGELVNKVKKAAAQKLFYSADTFSSSTVYFWCQQVIGALTYANERQQAAGGQSPDAAEGRTKMALIKQEFAPFLLRMLLKGKCFSVLKHFVTVFEKLETLGCSAPCQLSSLKDFANMELTTLAGPGVEWGGGDMGMRVTFFASPLYKDYAEQRAGALLSAAARATGDERAQLLSALGTAVENLDDRELVQRAGWATSMFTPGIPLDESLKHAMKDVERVRFASGFGEAGEVNWSIILMMVEPVDLPRGVTWAALDSACASVARAGCRKYVTNPIMAQVLDFRSEAGGALGFGSGAPGASIFVSAAVRAKLHGEWADGSSEVDADAIDADDLASHTRCIAKLWHERQTSVPLWVARIRERAAEQKAKKDAASSKLQAMAGNAELDALAAGSPAVAAEESGDDDAAPAAKPQPPRVRVTAKGGSKKKDEDRFVLGDIVTLDLASAGKLARQKYDKEEAQIIKVAPKAVKVTLLSGKYEGQTKQFAIEQCVLLQPSALRPAAAAESGSSSSAAVRPEATSAAARPAAPSAAARPSSASLLDNKQAKKFAAALFGDGEDEEKEEVVH